MPQPDRDHDVIVHHVRGSAAGGDRWAVFLGPAKRAELASAESAMVFARLLADVQQRRVWMTHGDDELAPVDHASLRGCACC